MTLQKYRVFTMKLCDENFSLQLDDEISDEILFRH